MSKARVYEIAKELNVDSKLIIEKLKEMNVEVKNHMSSVTEEDTAKVKQAFQKPEKRAEKPNSSANESASSLGFIRTRSSIRIQSGRRKSLTSRRFMEQGFPSPLPRNLIFIRFSQAFQACMLSCKYKAFPHRICKVQN